MCICLHAVLHVSKLAPFLCCRLFSVGVACKAVCVATCDVHARFFMATYIAGVVIDAESVLEVSLAWLSSGFMHLYEQWQTSHHKQGLARFLEWREGGWVLSLFLAIQTTMSWFAYCCCPAASAGSLDNSLRLYICSSYRSSVAQDGKRPL